MSKAGFTQDQIDGGLDYDLKSLNRIWLQHKKLVLLTNFNQSKTEFEKMSNIRIVLFLYFPILKPATMK